MWWTKSNINFHHENNDISKMYPKRNMISLPERLRKSIAAHQIINNFQKLVPNYNSKLGWVRRNGFCTMWVCHACVRCPLLISFELKFGVYPIFHYFRVFTLWLKWRKTNNRTEHWDENFGQRCRNSILFAKAFVAAWRSCLTINWTFRFLFCAAIRILEQWLHILSSPTLFH